MAINIHFFRENSLGRLDYAKLLEYFDNYPNFKTYYSEDEVEIRYVDKEFKSSYRYLVTKRCRVNQIYKLDPAYTNVNFLLELPILIPTFIAKEILGFAQKLCKEFELVVYSDTFEDVRQFNLVELYSLFDKTRNAYIDEFGLQNKIPIDTEKLSEICKYQRTVDSLREYYHNEVDVNYCEPMIDKTTNEHGISCTWNFGIPTVFPPHLDYICINDEENVKFMVRRADFYAIVGKYLEEIVGFLPDMYILKAKKARAARKTINKLRKFAIVDQNFKEIRISDFIDR